MQVVVWEDGMSSQVGKGRLEECGRSWMMKEEFEEKNSSVNPSYNLKQLNTIIALSCFRL